MPTPDLLICRDPDALAARAADLIIESARDAVRWRGRFTLVLAGGTAPQKTYQLLGQPERVAASPWSQSLLFFGDERFVPPEDERSNFRMVQLALLARVPVASSQVFPVPTQAGSAAEAAATYAAELAWFFATTLHAAPPRFDLVVLGLGEDGHTASLLPGSPALHVEDTCATWTPPGALPPRVDRITLTYPVLNAARQIVFLVSGEKKAGALRTVLEGQPSRDQCPAAGIRPADGTVTWLVDEDAAQLLTRRR